VKFLYAFFSGAAFVLHNIVILIREDPPVLPPNIQENAFQERFLRAQIQVQALGRPNENNFATRNVVVGAYF
jgi:hypothetical protein